MKKSKHTISDWLDKYSNPKIDKQVEKELEEIITKHLREMKTPMQELLEWIRTTLPMDLETPRMIEQKIESMLEKEKEVMIDFAYKFGDEPLVDIAKWYNKQFNGLGYGFVADLKQKPIRKH